MKTTKILIVCSLLLLGACSAKPDSGQKKSQTVAHSNQGSGNLSPMEIPATSADPIGVPVDGPNEPEEVTPPSNISGAGFDPDQSNLYIIKNFQSRKCLGIEGKSTANNAPVVQQPCEEGDAFQKFKVTEVEPGYYRIMNLGSYKILELRDKQVEEGTIIQQNDFFGADHQLFQISKDHSSTDRIKVKSAEAFIDVKDRSSSDGATIHIWDFRGQNNQVWLFLPTL